MQLLAFSFYIGKISTKINKYDIITKQILMKGMRKIEKAKAVGKEIIDILKNNILFFIGIALLVYKSVFLNALLGLEIKIDVIFYMLLVALFIMCPIINKKNKFAYIYLNIIYAIITLIIYADFLYYSYSTNFLSFYQIENLQYAKEIGNGLICIINIKNIAMFWFDNIILAILSYILYRKTESTSYSNKIGKAIAIIIIILLNIYNVQAKINEIYTSKSYNKSLIVQNASIYYYHYGDAKEYISNMFSKEKINEEKLKNIYDEFSKEKVNPSQYKGITKDKNVIILQLESLNGYVIDKKVNGKEITPNLNKFFRENICCRDMYNQGLGTTADSEFEMENSMYPLENGYVFQKYSKNNWLDIFSTLKNNGYYTSFMHPNTSTFWNRDEVYNSGYHIDEYNDIGAFPNIEKAGEFYSDEGFFEEAVDIMNKYDKKFCTTLVSVTTHIPFYLDGVSNIEEKLSITEKDMEQYEDDTFRRYLMSCNFVDYAFGKFLDKLEETKLLENSILIVYGDHGAGLTTSDQIAKLYQENKMDYNEFEDKIKDIHIPFGIKIPGIYEHSEIKEAKQKIDIKPTILELLGEEDKFSMGNSIFSEKDVTFIKGLGYITSKYYYINGKYYNRETLEEIEENQELKDMAQKMENEIYLSDSIIKNNLLELK